MTKQLAQSLNVDVLTVIEPYLIQRRNALRRKISWQLSFSEWWAIWSDSGHWEDRGFGHCKYVMSRKGDLGPYSLTNVFIQLADLNTSNNPTKKSGLPMGVIRTRTGKRFISRKYIDGRLRWLGTFDTPEEASAIYKVVKVNPTSKGV